MTVFDEYYKMLMGARLEKNYPARLAVYGRALPLIKSEVELKVIINELSIMVNLARADKESSLWKDFSSEDVRVKYLALLQLIDDNFTSMLVDESNARNEYGKTLDSLKDYEAAEQVATYAARFKKLSETLNMLTPETMDAFMTELTSFIADRTDGVTLVTAANGGAAQTLGMDLVYTATTWLAENVFYNKVLTQAKKRDKVTALIQQASKPITFAEYVGYIDSNWMSAKDRFTPNEKKYVIVHLANLVALPWLQLASAEDFDLSVAKDLLLRARANQMRDDKALVAQINALLPKLVYPLISGMVFMNMITDLIKGMRAVEAGSAAFIEAKKKFIAKASLWKTRVVLAGSGQLDVFNFATTLNALLKDPLISSAIENELKPILGDVAANLSSQGITFTIASAIDDLGGSTTSASSSTSSSGSSVLPSSSGSVVSITTSSGLSI